MIKNEKILIAYLNVSINSVFKILPLYEEKNSGLSEYIDSLLFELYGVENAVSLELSHEYLSLLSTIESLKKEIEIIDRKETVRREVFRCINIVKNMIGKLDKGA